MIVIVDYKSGNLTSLYRAVQELGHDVKVSDEPQDLLAASKIIFPGMGAARQAMDSLESKGLDVALREAIEKKIPLFGICVGEQILFEESEEDGGTKCLGILAGRVRRFDFSEQVRDKFQISNDKFQSISRDSRFEFRNLKVPHMGWNQVKKVPIARSQIPGGSRIWEGIADESWFYFAHSYYVKPEERSVIAGVTDYGGEFASVIAIENIIATQFHPEKSGEAGLRLLDNFCKK